MWNTITLSTHRLSEAEAPERAVGVTSLSEAYFLLWPVSDKATPVTLKKQETI